MTLVCQFHLHSKIKMDMVVLCHFQLSSYSIDLSVLDVYWWSSCTKMNKGVHKQESYDESHVSGREVQPRYDRKRNVLFDGKISMKWTLKEQTLALSMSSSASTE